ncbi:tetratricopeptide repeat-containing sulfotransferase family protein [Sphingomonas sp. PR090111-T3T-6A]|uniref:tetratricopeptide repeat-containing sulfotransferase family protein n=1 Tax=Sphingomonas sp. PR090111-T3T-6A TaxID=685778 RepID=UPI00036FE442|nr:sulfotransferase [Sphingomonas sp. PR090111-T3T-6A]
MVEKKARAQLQAALARGDIRQASILAEQAIAQGHSEILVYQLAAIRREDLGDWAGAHGMLAKALSLAPGEPAILSEIAAVWRRSGHPDRALEILDAMVARGLDHAPTWLERGHALNARNAYRDAQESYRRAARLDPQSASAWAGMADTGARIGDMAAARDFGERALALDPVNIVAANAVASVDIEEDRPDEARSRLENLLGRVPEAEPGLVQSWTLLGDACHALGHSDAAFDHYVRAQASYRRMMAPLFGDERRGQRALIHHVQDQVIGLEPAAWPPLRPDETPGRARRHVFLMGYPRSGTTMVENVLASLPDVVALEEKPTMIATEPLLGSADGVARLGELDQHGADELRAAYWRAVAAQDVDVSGRTFIDMNPIRGISLPIIARLFPDARIVIMRRDPRDVVWSCFRRHFTATPTGYVFSDLESAARHYDALMTLMEACFERLPLDVHILRYDDLVSDFDGTTQRLCKFIGLEWAADVHDFRQTAMRRGVTTASVRQVRKGLFNGTGQWRPYAAQLAPVLPILQPWVERFGYAD